MWAAQKEAHWAKERRDMFTEPDGLYASMLSIGLPLPSNRQHASSPGVCLEDKREDNQNCSVLCCVRQLCTMIHVSSSFIFES